MRVSSWASARVLLVDGFGHQPNARVRAVSLEVALHRNHHEVVLRVAEHAAQLLGHPHHLVRRAFHLDGLIDRVCTLEETRPDVVADEDHRRVTPRFFRRDPAADPHLHIVNRRDIIGDALDVHILHGVALVGHARAPRDHHADALQQGGVALDELVFVALDLRVAFHHFVELLGVPGAEPRHADDAEPVGAHVGHLVGDVQIHTMDQRGDGDQRGGGQNDAEQREETAQLILVQ